MVQNHLPSVSARRPSSETECDFSICWFWWQVFFETCVLASWKLNGDSMKPVALGFALECATFFSTSPKQWIVPVTSWHILYIYICMIYISLHSMHFYFFPGASHTSCRGIFNSKPEIGNANASTKWSMLPADCTGKPLYSGLIPKKSLDATEPSQKKTVFCWRRRVSGLSTFCG